jgi:phosphoribosylaminoimidazole-succinocarboxamide synthase
VECVVRGYLAGSGWREYKSSGTICGIKLPKGLKQSAKLEEPIFTPATKAEEGTHDENISFEQTCEMHGEQMMSQLRDTAIELYKRGAKHAEGRGVILADTKFEFGRLPDGELLLIDEVLTPDSSRFWPAEVYKPGRDQPSYDKQFVRNYLDSIKFDRKPPAPPLPAEIVENTREKYIEAYKNITGLEFQWE